MGDEEYENRREKGRAVRREMRHCWRSDDDSVLTVIVPEDTLQSPHQSRAGRSPSSRWAT